MTSDYPNRIAPIDPSSVHLTFREPCSTIQMPQVLLFIRSSHTELDGFIDIPE